MSTRTRAVVVVALVGMFVFVGCAAPRRMIFPYGAAPHSLIVTQIVVRYTRDTVIQQAGPEYKTLLASGIPDADIGDGSLAVGRINCCHDSTERANAIAFYLPSGLGAEVGDLVEVRFGRSPEKEGEPGEANQATRVVQKRSASGPCRWEPPQQGAMKPYGSVIYCDWMQEQGWAAVGPAPSIYKSWIKTP